MKQPLEWAKEVSNFLLELSKEMTDEQRDELLDTGESDGMPYDDFPYGEALWRWHNDNQNPRSFFYTEDPYMIMYAEQLTEKFGLPVMSREQAYEYTRDCGTRCVAYRFVGNQR